VAFSLDDGYFDQVDIAGEIFHQFDCPSTVFLITDFIDGRLWPWDQQLVYIAGAARIKQFSITIGGRVHALNLNHRFAYRDAIDLVRKHAPDDAYTVAQQIAAAAQVELPATPPQEYRPTTWESVRNMEKKGMQFGAHSLSHRLIAGLNDVELEHEIKQSVARVREECSRPANIFCYPLGKNGEFDQRGIAHLKALDMLGAFSAEPGFLTTPGIRRDQNNRFAIPRMTIPEDFNQFKLSVSWAQYLRESLQP
jgi:peptidoglycan/xylan/chitin deacetylase (PgdA/CDA1 family)